MLRLIIFLMGFGLSVIGFMYIITYLNYLTVGYPLKEYLKMIFTNTECLLAFVGLFLLLLSISKGR